MPNLFCIWGTKILTRQLLFSSYSSSYFHFPLMLSSPYPFALRFAGIHCRYICGHSKGAGYRPGMPLKDNRLFRNTWIAVYVADAWRFINCNWAARYINSECFPTYQGSLSGPNQASSVSSIHLPEAELLHRLDEFYFLTDPEQHIFEHFPDQKAWQLLRKPISLDRFVRLPLLKSPFFNADLSLYKNYAEQLVTKNGQKYI
ncbi:unnamed protein product [Protopolystoma xenopodis]|uniref:Transglutaminase-like domain-containing protein n=1 Tax=Protopolystoma xenopodis TaxID=117903 RepID=A0A3S4ZVI6_9PLAT|nr:unnamed protein product [Protopolystoma xenopodis]